MRSLIFGVGFLFMSFSLYSQSENNVRLYAGIDSRQIQFAIGEIQASLGEKGHESVVLNISQINRLKDNEYSIVMVNIGDKANLNLLDNLKISDIEKLKSEGFIIHKSNGNSKTIWILGKDEAGAMYGGLEVAEIIQVRRN
jgi:alpha-glucuronidase